MYGFDLRPLLWFMLLCGCVIGACGYCVGKYGVDHIDVDVEWKP